MTTDDQMQQLLTRVQYLEDRQAIADVVMRHARAHDRHDAELMNSCFWEDSVDEHGELITPGPEYGDTANGWHAGGFFGHTHNMMNHTCEIDGDTAHCESYVISAMLPRHTPGRSKFTSGRYIDRMEKRNGEWKIVVRRTIIDVDIEADAPWPQGDLPATFPRGVWDRSDVSYARPLELDSPAPRWDGTTR